MNDLYNPSHCLDTTAKEALDNIDKKNREDAKKQRARDLIGCLLRLCSLSGYEVVSDITIRSKLTGVEYSSKRKWNRGDSQQKDK